MKILGGYAKGFSVKAPDDLGTKPTSVMLKRRLFDAYQNLHDYIFLDLCAGSGAIGLEAISREAQALYLNEMGSHAFKSLKFNSDSFMKKFQVENIYLSKKDFLKFLEGFSFIKGKKYFVFFDPPYEEVQMYRDFFYMIKNKNFEGIIVVEACSQKTMSNESFEKEFGLYDKQFKQGTSFFYLYKNGSKNE